MERKDEKRMVLTEMTFNNVKFENFPSYVDEDNEVTYSLMDAVVADRVAEQFPDDTKPAIIVDWSKLDVETLTQEAKDELDIKSPFKSREEAEVAEQQLITAALQAGVFRKE